MFGALTFIFVLGVLVIVHEFGHFIVARAVGIRVEKFSVGFGPVIFGKKMGETEYCVSLLPLGGFVKLAGESADESTGKPWEFNSKNLLQKFAVVFAGPFMNALLSFVIFSAVFMLGQPVMTATIGKVLEGSPAQSAGLLAQDKVVAVDGAPVQYWEDLLKKIHETKGPLSFRVDRSGQLVDLAVTPTTREAKDIFGKATSTSFVGISPGSDVVYVKSPVFKSIQMGFDRVVMMTGMIFYSLWLLVTGTLPFKESLTGPIGIYFMTQSAAQMGAVYLFYFMASLSMSLFVLNLLPIPVLDGGHVLFIIIEKIKGSPLKDSFKEKMTQGGMVALLGLMAFVILQDVHRFAILDNILKFFKR